MITTSAKMFLITVTIFAITVKVMRIVALWATECYAFHIENPSRFGGTGFCGESIVHKT